MASPSAQAVFLEIQRRRLGKLGVIGAAFPEQKKAILDTSSKKCVQCPGRAGKTIHFLLEVCADASKPEHAGYKYSYIALSRDSAYDIAWEDLHELDERFNLGIHFQEQKLRAVFPNRAALRLYGADKPGWMRKLYGVKQRKIGIDEAAFYAIDLRAFVEDILEMRVADLAGSITLMSIPGFTTGGYYYDIMHGKIKGWSIHKWDVMDNPHMAPIIEKKIAELIAADPDVVNQPHFRRNYLGEWCYDQQNLVYSFDYKTNTHLLTEWDPKTPGNYILGFDTGWTDNTAFSLCHWAKDSPTFTEIESFAKKSIRMDEAAGIIAEYTRTYPGLTIVADMSQKQFIEEMRKRYRIPFVSAEKAQKAQWIEVINSELRSGTIKIMNPNSSPHVEEMSNLVKKRMASGTWVETPGHPNDCSDAFLYAYRFGYAYRSKLPVVKPKPGTREYHDLEEERMIKSMVNRMESKGKWWKR